MAPASNNALTVVCCAIIGSLIAYNAFTLKVETVKPVAISNPNKTRKNKSLRNGSSVICDLIWRKSKKLSVEELLYGRTLREVFGYKAELPTGNSSHVLTRDRIDGFCGPKGMEARMEEVEIRKFVAWKLNVVAGGHTTETSIELLSLRPDSGESSAQLLPVEDLKMIKTHDGDSGAEETITTMENVQSSSEYESANGCTMAEGIIEEMRHSPSEEEKTHENVSSPVGNVEHGEKKGLTIKKVNFWDSDTDETSIEALSPVQRRLAKQGEDTIKVQQLQTLDADTTYKHTDEHSRVRFEPTTKKEAVSEKLSWRRRAELHPSIRDGQRSAETARLPWRRRTSPRHKTPQKKTYREKKTPDGGAMRGWDAPEPRRRFRRRENKSDETLNRVAQAPPPAKAEINTKTMSGDKTTKRYGVKYKYQPKIDVTKPGDCAKTA